MQLVFRSRTSNVSRLTVVRLSRLSIILTFIEMLQDGKSLLLSLSLLCFRFCLKTFSRDVFIANFLLRSFFFKFCGKVFVQRFFSQSFYFELFCATFFVQKYFIAKFLFPNFLSLENGRFCNTFKNK